MQKINTLKNIVGPTQMIQVSRSSRNLPIDDIIVTKKIYWMSSHLNHLVCILILIVYITEQ